MELNLRIWNFWNIEGDVDLMRGLVMGNEMSKNPYIVNVILEIEFPTNEKEISGRDFVRRGNVRLASLILIFLRSWGVCDQGLNDQPSLEVCVTGLVMKEREVAGSCGSRDWGPSGYRGKNRWAASLSG